MPWCWTTTAMDSSTEILSREPINGHQKLQFHSIQFHPHQPKREMGSKAIIFLGLFLATVLLTTPVVTARDLAETSTSAKQSNGADDTRFFYGGGGYGGYPGGLYGGYPGGGYGGYPRKDGSRYTGKGGKRFPGRGSRRHRLSRWWRL